MDTVKLLLPLEDGKPKYRKRIKILDVNERYGDTGVAEVSPDDPNIDWVLQDPDVVRVEKSTPIMERDGPPTDVIDQGTDGISEERDEYTFEKAELQGKTLVQPDEIESHELQNEVIEVDENPDIPDQHSILKNEYDLSNPIYVHNVGSFVGDGTPVIHEDFYVYPNEKLVIPLNYEASEQFRGTGIGLKFDKLILKEIKKRGAEQILQYTFPSLIERWNKSETYEGTYSRLEYLPEPDDTDAHWYLRDDRIE